ncbi:arginase family protein [Pseudoalteromonas luteoviolacea]|uniref:arginase family protein n=1 Tax=Pseudoalteromonas luteoviolacea TaxID=43657 RepID=UPI0011534C74|nr:arginase family protein [Pseudoalteromonas luteoviolacea]TQF67490.1 arginase family protein [Pseudoalteromonas luteoviolacea]
MSNSKSQYLEKLENCLCPPGDGVFTVNTAKERKEALRQKLYGQTEGVENLWKDSLKTIEQSEHKAAILGISSDCGGGILRGANWGPLFLRSTLIEQQPETSAFDLGDVRVIPHLLHDKYLNEGTISNCQKALYQDEDSDYFVAPLSITEDVCDGFYKHYPDKGVFGIGGDHSISYPLTKAYLKAKRDQGKRTAIIHFDAHTDLLVERLGIDLCFGSWCTHILEFLPAPHHLIQFGIRSSGKAKEHWEGTFGVKQHWAHEIREQGAEAIVAQVIEQLKADNVDELYVSFDIDALDEEFAAATGTPETGGLTPEEAMTILKALSEEFPITGADMMEIAPFTDSSLAGQSSSETTLREGAKLSAFLIDAMNKA